MALIPDVHLSGSFVNLNTQTGLAVNHNFLLQNKSSKDVVVVSSLIEPTSTDNGIHIKAYDSLILPPTTNYYITIGD